MPSLDRTFATSGRAMFIVSGTEYDCQPFNTSRKPLAAWPLPLPAQPTNNALVPVCNCAAPPADWPLMLSSAHCLLVRKPLAAWPLPLPAQPTNNALVPVCNCAAPPADWPLMLSSAHCLLVAIAGMEPVYAANAAF